RDKLVTGVQTCALPISAAASVSSEKAIGFDQWPLRKKTRIVSRPHCSIASQIVTTFPSDFDIFEPTKRSSPLCVQICAKSWPREIGRASCREKGVDLEG